MNGTGPPLSSMRTVVNSKGWSIHPNNEAYILLNLGRRMHVKVVTVVGSKSGGTYEDALKSHFIGLYDQTDSKLST